MKTNTFDMKRFGMLFGTEFVAGIRKNWISLLLISCLSLIAFLVHGTINFVFTGNFSFGAGHLAARCVFLGIYLIMVGIIFPAKLYGHVNERGSSISYLLLPASRFEKYLSMILNCVIVIPLLSLLVFLGVDAAICGVGVLAHGSSEMLPGISVYAPVAAVLFSNLGNLVPEIPEMINLNHFTPAAGASSLFFWLEVFLLGALYFKVNKSSKTLLTILVIYMASGILFSGVITLVSAFVSENLFEGLMYKHFNLAAMTAIWQTFINVVMLAVIWFRFKSLKA